MSGPVVPVSAIDERLAKISSAIRDLELERDMLSRLRARAIPATPNPPAQPPETSNGKAHHPTVPGLKLTTAKAIEYVIKSEPGLKPFEVVNRATEIVDTTAPDKRRLLFSAVSSMAKKGRFRRDDEGRLFPR